MANKNHPAKSNQFLAIALGDPEGIGIEVTLKAIGARELDSEIKPLIVGCKKSIEKVYKKLNSQGSSSLMNLSKLEIEDIPYEGKIISGVPTKESGEASFEWLTRAAEIVNKGKARALVTAPIAKYAWHLAGHYYPGQTERLSEITNSQDVAMLFTATSPNTGWRLNTLLATTHIPLAYVPQTLSAELIISKLNMLLTFCERFSPRPNIVIAGLNPHSGENGQLGKEEIEWINPILNNWRVENPHVNLEGPVPPDTCWLSAVQAWQDKKKIKSGPEGFLALYHDQGLIPMKLIAFDEAVNTTLGLPFIRTSPDHGTAFGIASKGIARPNSMFAAIQTAWELSRN